MANAPANGNSTEGKADEAFEALLGYMRDSRVRVTCSSFRSSEGVVGGALLPQRRCGPALFARPRLG
jgi:hypothetical protein